MIVLTHSSVQPILSKSQNVVIIEYSLTSLIPGGTTSDNISLRLPDIRLIGLTYCPKLVSVKTMCESANYQINFAETLSKLLLEDIVLQVRSIDKIYYETNMEIFCNTHNDNNEIILSINNNDVVNINSMLIRLVYEVFQYTLVQNP